MPRPQQVWAAGSHQLASWTALHACCSEQPAKSLHPPPLHPILLFAVVARVVPCKEMEGLPHPFNCVPHCVHTWSLPAQVPSVQPAVACPEGLGCGALVPEVARHHPRPLGQNLQRSRQMGLPVQHKDGLPARMECVQCSRLHAGGASCPPSSQWVSARGQLCSSDRLMQVELTRPCCPRGTGSKVVGSTRRREVPGMGTPTLPRTFWPGRALRQDSTGEVYSCRTSAPVSLGRTQAYRPGSGQGLRHTAAPGSLLKQCP